MKEFITKHLSKIIWGIVLCIVTFGIYTIVKLFRK